MPPEARSRSQHWHKEEIPADAIDMLLIMMLSLYSFVSLTPIELFGCEYCLGTLMEIQTKAITESMPLKNVCTLGQAYAVGGSI